MRVACAHVGVRRCTSDGLGAQFALELDGMIVQAKSPGCGWGLGTLAKLRRGEIGAQ